MYQRKVDVDMLNAVNGVCWLTFRALALRQSKGVLTLVFFKCLSPCSISLGQESINDFVKILAFAFVALTISPGG